MCECQILWETISLNFQPFLCQTSWNYLALVYWMVLFFSLQLILLRKLLLICLQELKRLVKMKYSYCASHSTNKIILWWFPLERIKLFLKARVVGLKFTYVHFDTDNTPNDTLLCPSQPLFDLSHNTHHLFRRLSQCKSLGRKYEYEFVFPPIFTGTWPSYFT